MINKIEFFTFYKKQSKKINKCRELEENYNFQIGELTNTKLPSLFFFFYLASDKKEHNKIHSFFF